MEYLITYGWTLLILAVAIFILYFFIYTPRTIAPSQCAFSGGVYCNDLVLGTNTITHATKLVLFLTNTQPYSMLNPQLIVSVNGKNSTAVCTPSFVLSGGSIICTIDVPINTTVGQYVAGQTYLVAKYCGLGTSPRNLTECNSLPVQKYAGNFNSHAFTLTNMTTTMTLAVQYPQMSAYGAKDMLSATILLYGYPLKGATVQFFSNSSFVSMYPNSTTSSSNGTAISYIWSDIPGKVLVTASYANGTVTANGIINFYKSTSVTSSSSSSTTTLTTSTTTTVSTTSITVTPATFIYCVHTSQTSSNAQTYFAPISSTGVGTWVAGPTYPFEMNQTGCSIYNGYIYCVGSLNPPYNPVYYAPISSTGIGAWTATTSYPTSMNFAGCSTYNGYIYCVENTSSSVSPYYAPVSSTGIGTWTATTNYPISFASAGCSIYNGYIYCVGSSFSPHNVTYYAPVSSTGIGTWTATTNYPISFASAGCSIYNGYIYCVGGASISYNPVYYAPVSSTGIGAWTATTSYPLYFWGAGCSIHNGYIYCVGSFESPTNQVYYAPVSSTGIGPWVSTTSYPFGMHGSYCQIPGSGGGFLGGGGPN